MTPFSPPQTLVAAFSPSLFAKAFAFLHCFFVKALAFSLPFFVLPSSGFTPNCTTPPDYTSLNLTLSNMLPFPPAPFHPENPLLNFSLFFVLLFSLLSFFQIDPLPPPPGGPVFAIQFLLFSPVLSGAHVQAFSFQTRAFAPRPGCRFFSIKSLQHPPFFGAHPFFSPSCGSFFLFFSGRETKPPYSLLSPNCPWPPPSPRSFSAFSPLFQGLQPSFLGKTSREKPPPFVCSSFPPLT